MSGNDTVGQGQPPSVKLTANEIKWIACNTLYGFGFNKTAVLEVIYLEINIPGVHPLTSKHQRPVAAASPV